MDKYATKADMYSETKDKVSEMGSISREMGRIENQSEHLVAIALKLLEMLSPILKPESPSPSKMGKSDNSNVPMAQALSKYGSSLSHAREILEGIMSRVDL